MEFQDRVSAYPNRYVLTTQDGTASYVILERADEPVVPGTPLNAETFNTMFGSISPDSIGAASASHTHTPSSIGAAKASHTHTPASIGAATESHTHSNYCVKSGTSTAYLPPTMADFEACNDARGAYNEMYDLNGDGVVDLVDSAIMYAVMQGDFSDWTNKKKSNVTVTINPSNPDGVIHITGTNMWGSTVEADIGVDTLFLKRKVEFLSVNLDSLASRVRALEDAV